MPRCSHGLPFEVKCPQCLAEALQREHELNKRQQLEQPKQEQSKQEPKDKQ